MREKRKNPFEPKICLYKGFKFLYWCVIPHENRNSEEAIVSWFELWCRFDGERAKKNRRTFADTHRKSYIGKK